MYINEESYFTSNEVKNLKKMLKNPEEDVQKLLSLIHKKDRDQIKKFREAEKSFRSLIEQTTDAVFCYEFNYPIPIDLSIDEQVKLMYDCILVDCNLVCAQFYGAERVEDVIGRNLTELFGTTPGSLNKLFRNMVESGYQIVDGVGIEKIPGEEDRYYLNNGRGVIENKKLLRIWGTFRDITKRKKAKQELKKKENLLKKAQRVAHIGHFSLKVDTLEVSGSDELFDIFRLTQEEATLEAFAAVVHPDDREYDLYHINRGLKYGESWDIEHRLDTKNGAEKWVHAIGEAIKDKKGKVIMLIGTVQDITDRKKAELKLKESEEELRKLNKELEQKVEERSFELKKSEEKWRALGENSPAHVMLLDEDQNILFINRTVSDLTVEEVIGNSIYDYTPLEYKNIAAECCNHVLQTGEPCSYTTNYLTKENMTKYFEVWIGPVFQSGKVIALISHSLDITERKILEQAIKKREHALEERIKELTCLYDISRLVERSDISIKQLVAETLDLIPPAWQYPELTCAKITYDGCMNSTKNYAKTEWGQKVEIKVNNEVVGAIEVYFLKEKPRRDEGPFLKEERNLIIALAEILGRFFERKNADQMLHESESKLKNVLSAIPDQINIMDKDFNIIFCNDLVEELYGPNVVGNKCYEIFHGFSDVCDNCYVAITLKDGKIRDDECVRIDKDGNKHDCWCISNVATVNDKGEPVSILEISRDITEKKIAEKKLRESEERFRNLNNVLEQKVEDRTREKMKEKNRAELYLNLVNVITVALDKEGNIALINKKGNEILEYEEGELIGKNWFKTCLPKNQINDVFEVFKKFISGQLEFFEFYENPVITKNGEERIIAWHNALLYDDNGNISGTLGSGNDITERKLAEQKLKESEERLRKFMESAPDTFMLFDSEINMIDINRIGVKRFPTGKSLLILQALQYFA